jgi:acyl carrier protein
MNLSNDIREYIIDNFLFGEPGNLSDDTSFMEGGIVDSTGILEIVGYIEEKYGISIGDAELIPENFNSINNISKFLERKLNGHGA